MSNDVKLNPRCLAEIRRLSHEHHILDIKTDCSKARKKIAIERGEEDDALMADEEFTSQMIDLEAAHDMLWNYIHETHPEISRGGHWSLNVRKGIVEGGDDMGEVISRSLAKVLSGRMG